MSSLLIYFASTAITILIFGILALSVNLQYGSAGIFNFGIVAFFMIGAYASASLTLAGVPFVISVIVGAALSGGAGFLISLPALNLRGDFLALATFMFAQVINIFVLNIQFLGGAVGIAHVPSAFPWIGSYNGSVVANLVLSILLFLGFYLVYRVLMVSPYGRVLKSIRDNETLSEALGKNTFRYKSQVFVIGSIIAGIDGAVYAQYLGFAGTELFTYSVTFTVYIMSIIGGSSTGAGAILGSIIYTVVQTFLLIAKDVIVLPIDPNNLLFILFGLITVLLLYFRPEGIIRERMRKVDFKSRPS
ncbi:MAG: branched-chain amino acid ABC transporter permease [Nitrososphaerota archaeon]|nr:branched-chain amino acid ABC transporter permease [Nitrososphaerota archaeon]